MSRDPFVAWRKSGPSLEQRIARLEDIEEISRLIARYAKMADCKNEPARFKPLVTHDVKAVFHGFGSVEGRDEVAYFIHEIAKKEILWSIHYMTAPIIDILDDQDTAKVFFYLWEVGLTNVGEDPAYKDGQSTWISGWYENEARRTQDGWRFSKIELILKLFAPAANPDWRPRAIDREPPR